MESRDLFSITESSPLGEFTPIIVDNFFYQLFEQSQDAILIVTDEFSILEANPAATRMLGYEPDEFFGMSTTQLVAGTSETLLQPNDLSDNRSGAVEVHLETSQGEEIVASISVSVCEEIATHESLMVCIIHDLTEEHTLRKKLIDVQEEERRQIGRDLHDGIGSELVGAMISLDRCIEQMQEGEDVSVGELVRIRGEIARSTTELRNLSRGLNPVHMGPEYLPIALEQLSQSVPNSIQSHFEYADPTRKLNLSEEEATHLFRIAQEATANAMKHGSPTRLEIFLRQSNTGLVLVVEDDGTGFDPSEIQSEGLGLYSMRYRANLIDADLQIESNPGEGTRIRCELSS